MYDCEKCGIIESEWCDDCEDLIECDCSDMTVTRFKDLMFDTKDGEKTVTINLHHCGTCGEKRTVEIR